MNLDPILFLQPARVVDPDSWVGHIAFAHYLVKLIRPRLIVELGAHSGNSASAFAHAQTYLDIEGQTHAIDSWEGDSQATFYGGHIYEDFLEFSRLNFNGRLILKKGYFQDKLADYDDESINLVHIDGCHSYDNVKADYESWLPKLAPNGVMLFHDTTVTQNAFGVHRYWSEIAPEFPHFELPDSHGLGVLMPKGVANAQLQEFADNGLPSELLYFLSMRRTELMNYIATNRQAEIILKKLGPDLERPLSGQIDKASDRLFDMIKAHGENKNWIQKLLKL
ncbi:class I SAM-dependent methyltransferase [Cerasicoccus maritimus]|uniref:class I SAM-dependent methyltransferase n=1 Tax=Cerasicoccus maritimus TaxID=490089 RepID=UPI0028524DAD|nr:class I SAM-dependent methyltransferase [Cerasicoccus maritimus]